jgi:quinol monooxygenase YgiN
MEKDIRVVAFLKVRPDAKDAVEAAVRACVSASRDEGGCLMYAGHWDQRDPSRLVFVEHWMSQAALDEHMTTPHFKTFVEEIGGLVEGSPDILTLREIK